MKVKSPNMNKLIKAYSFFAFNLKHDMWASTSNPALTLYSL